MSVGRADNAESGIGDRRTDNGASTPVPSQPERVEHSGILPETAAHSVPTSPAPLSVPLASPVVPPAPYAPAGRLSLQEQSAGVQLFSFSAQRPLVFGVSLIHIWEKNGRFSAFGNKHEDLDYAGS